MKVVAYTPLLYGKKYLQYAIASVADFVDRHIILYTPEPSYGHGTDLSCPDTEEQLRECVSEFQHVKWMHAPGARSETEHRGAVMGCLDGTEDILLPVDADEVWHPVSLDACLRTVYTYNSMREWRVTGMVHLWKSFNWACTDQMAPVRLVDLRHDKGENHIHCRIYHFGYAQDLYTTRYKWAIHGHKPELRPNWFEEKFVNWQPGDEDVHPTCEGVWNPKPFDKKFMPLFMKFHPYYDLEVIG